MRLPIRQPTAIATSAVGSESAGTRIAPATMTSSETPRFAHSSPRSKPPSTRRRSGTGSIPQVVSCSGIARGYRRALVREQLAQDVREDAAVAEVVALARRVEPHRRPELLVVRPHRDLL